MPLPEALPFGDCTKLRHWRWGSTAELILAQAPSGQTVVLKCLAPHLLDHPLAGARLREEGRLGQRLRHPGLVHTLDAGSMGGRPYVALEFIDGTSLEDLRASRTPPDAPPSASEQFRPFDLRWVAEAGLELAQTLDYLHNVRPEGRSTPIVHRDVSPGNVLVTGSGSVKLIDLGLAACDTPELAGERGALLGTVAYAAPEQLTGATVDRRADVFSLGVLLFELWAGQRLFFRSTPAATLLAVLEAPIPPLRSLRPELAPEAEKLVMKALARDPADRWPTMGAVASALRILAGK